MAKNDNLTRAKARKNDEFYTQYDDIQREMNAYLEFDPDVFRGKTVLLPCDDPEWSNFTMFFAANFGRLGLRKLISTSYAPAAIHRGEEGGDPRGRVFVLEADANGDGVIDFRDITWRHLKGDGDFRSTEVTALRDEADVVITNPPFSLFREFLSWVMEGGKRFSVIGSMNAITYKEVFPLIRDNRIWLGKGFKGSAYFRPAHDISDRSESFLDKASGLVKFGNIIWLTNLTHGRRHQPLVLMSAPDNLRFNKKMAGKAAYDRYDNYDAIDVPFTSAIPIDHDGAMGVPISFLDKYCPEQFEILMLANGNSRTNVQQDVLDAFGYQPHADDKGGLGIVNGERVYARILIRKIK